MNNPLYIIPLNQRRKRIPKPLQNLNFTPFNDDFGILTKDIISKDDLRPIMQGNYFDKENKAIVGTDAHKLYHLPMTKESEKFNGVYYRIQDMAKNYNSFSVVDKPTFNNYLKDYGEIEGKFPNYEAVTPALDSGRIIKNIDVQKLWYISTICATGKFITEKQQKEFNISKEDYNKSKIATFKDYYLPVLNAYTNKMEFLVKDRFGEIKILSFNAKFVAQICKFMLQMGVYTCDFEYTEKNRATLFRFGDKKYLLLMPVMNDLPEIIENLEFYNESEIGISDVAYYMNENKVISKDKLFDIDEELGFKAIKRVSNSKPKTITKTTSKSKPKTITKTVIKSKEINTGKSKKEIIQQAIDELEQLAKSLGDKNYRLKERQTYKNLIKLMG